MKFNVKKKSIKKTILVISCIVFYFIFSSLFSTASAEKKLMGKVKSFSIKLGSSRVVYELASSGAKFSVSNPQNYPVLIQSYVLNEDMKTVSNFLVTPPVIKLDGGQQSRLRIVRTGGELQNDRESLRWLCVKGIPPKEDDAWNEGQKLTSSDIDVNIMLSTNNCIKLFIRPGEIKKHLSPTSTSLTWQLQGNKLKATNNTPFYINLSSLQLDDIKIKQVHYVPPFGTYDFPVASKTKSGKIQWKYINDYGGESDTIENSIL